MNDNITFEEEYTVICLNSNNNTYVERTFKDEPSVCSFIDDIKFSDTFNGRIFISSRITSNGLVEVL